MTKDENPLIVAASNDRTPAPRYVYDVKADKLTKLAEINPHRRGRYGRGEANQLYGA